MSAGNAAQGVALAARQAGAPLLGDGDGHRAGHEDPRHRTARRVASSRATYDECWRTVEAHGSDRMTGHFVHPFDDDRFIAGNATVGTRDLSKTCPTSTRSSRRSAAADCCRASPRPCARAEAGDAHLRRGAGDGRAAGRVACRRPPGVLRRLAGVVRRRRGRQVGARHDVAAARAAGRLDRRHARRSRRAR